MEENNQKDIIGESLSAFRNNTKRKIANKTSDFFTGWSEGSVFSIIGRTITFIKESVQAMKEASRLRRADKDNRGD